ncbi:MAG: hypothetical protein AAF909_03125 [Pseudomonadota bacterium]
MKDDQPRVEDARVYHHHIGKTAGTSLRTWFSGMFDFDRCCPIVHDFRLRDKDADYLADFQFFTGHHNHALVERLRALGPTQVFTFLREPIARERSHWSYLRKLPAKDIARHDDPKRGLSAMAALARRPDPSAYLGASPWNLQTATLLPARPGRDRAAAAFENLLGYDAFGLVEETDRSMLSICAALGAYPRPLTERLNVTASKRRGGAMDWSGEAVAQATRQNEQDLALYGQARKVFDQRWSALLETLDVTPGPHEVSETARKLAARARPRALWENTEFDMRRGMYLSGWHDRHLDRRRGHWMRFAGPTTVSRIWAPLNRRRPCRLELDALDPMSPKIVEELTVTVDGQPMTARRRRGGGWFKKPSVTFEATLPPLDKPAPFTELKFDAPELRSDRNPRPRSFALGHIRVA